MYKNRPENNQDFVILNSVSFFERARPLMEEHQSIQLYLDRDAAGQNCNKRVLEMNPKYTDESSLYKNHKDLNDYLVNSGKPLRKHLGYKLR